jgi:hypothetical protein
LTATRRAEEACKELGTTLPVKHLPTEMQDIIGQLSSSPEIQKIVMKLVDKVSEACLN